MDWLCTAVYASEDNLVHMVSAAMELQNIISLVMIIHSFIL